MELFIALANAMAARWIEIIWPAVWQSAVLAALVYCLARRMRRAPAAFRFWIWMLVPMRLLVAPWVGISLPVLPLLSPNLAIESPARDPAPIDRAPGEAISNAPASEFVPAGGRFESQSAPPSSATVSWHGYVLLAWCGGVAFQTMRMARGWWRVRRVVRSGHAVTNEPVTYAALRAAAILKLKKTPSLLLTAEVGSPFACGIWRPTVVLPTDFAQHVSKAGLLAVLTHEFAHLRRRDPLFGALLSVCDALYFFHPVTHWVRRQILFERERTCDEMVLAVTRTTAADYANALWTAAQFASAARPMTTAPVLVVESFGDLKGRLTALSSELRPKPVLSRPSFVFLLVFGALSIPGITLTSADPVEHAAGAVVANSSNGRDVPPTLQASASTVSEGPRESVPTRILHFPRAQALGVVSVRRAPELLPYRLGPDYNAVDKWDYVAAARGDVAVPAGREVKLRISGHTLRRDLSALRTFGPNDLDALELYCPDDVQVDADHDVMPYLAGLTGLKTLVLSLPSLTDQGMRYIKGLTALEDLHLRALGVTDSGFEYLEGMQSLQSLWAWATVTDQGLAHVGKLTSLRELSINVTSVRGPGLSHLAPLAKLEHLELQGANFGNSGLKYLSDLRALKSLWLRGEDLKISDAGMRHIGGLTGLERLHLSRIDSVTDAGITYLKDLKSLRSLDVGKSTITEKAVETISGMESVEELWLSNNLKSPMTDQCLSHLPKLRNLKRLHVLGASNGPITDQGLAYLGTMSALRELSVCGGEGISDSGIGRLAALPRLERLMVTTDSQHVSDASLTQIGKLENLKFLYLYCSRYPFTTSGLNELNQLTSLEYLYITGAKHDKTTLNWSALTRLEDLTFEMKPFKDADLESIGKLANLKRLQGLSDVGDNGLAHLAGLVQLQSLTMDRCKLTDDGLRSLENLKNLETLALSGSFTSQGLEALEKFHRLQALIVSNTTPLSAQAKTRLQDILPNLTLLKVNTVADAFLG